ncbi:MAG: alpha-galactosidase [Phycisphaera sp.]|nr:alpha-galactosidase [Phycisphaera sp.]
MTTKIAGCELTVENQNTGLDVTLTPRPGEHDGVEYLDVHVNCDKPMRPSPVKIVWEYKTIEVHHRTNTQWQTTATSMGRHRTKSSAAQQAPLWCLYNYAGVNRLTFAVADAINTFELGAHHAEETARLTCKIEFFIDPIPPLTEYRTTVRFDTRRLPYWDILQSVSDWWAAMPEYTPAPVPEHARLPMYSTWYSYHLDITPESIEKECKLAKALGMQSVIVDDGWQTEVKFRGYAYCGDWEPTPAKFPDFRAHVDRVHAIGMKYLLWYSVPFVGVHTKAFERFRGKFLDPDPTGKKQWFVLDPRFPDVREYLIDIYERAIRDYDLDGFKLDFVDCFGTHEATKDAFGDGRDYESVPEAADRLLTDVITRLRAIKPDVMVEFRQAYIGPAMRKYGNIFRVGDVPNSAAGNRVNSMLLRALCGNTAVHSDMVMWHYEDSVESAAMQLVHALFTVPQISVRLDGVPKSHVEMIRRYCAFWREHRDVLLDGKIRPLQPQHAYPAIVAETDTKVAGVAFADGFLPLPKVGQRKLLLANGTLFDQVVIELPDELGQRRLRVWSCTGRLMMDQPHHFPSGPQRVAVPPAGTAEVSWA